MNITEFLDREVNTKLVILRFLYLKGHWYSTKQIAENTGLNQHTVLKYLKLLQSDSLLYLESTSPLIQHEKGKGHRFIGDALDHHKLYYQIVKSSNVFSFISDMLLYNEIDIEDFCEKYYTSETIPKKIIKKLKTALKPYRISLKNIRNKVTIIGDEKSIRYFEYVFFWGTFKGIIWPFEEIIEKEVVEHFLKDQFSRYSVMKTVSYSQWSYILAINICRFKNGNEITSDDLPDYAEELNQALFFSSSEVFDSNSLLENFYNLYPTTRNEFNYFALITQIGVRVYLIPTVLDRALSFHRQMRTPIFEMYELLTSVFSKELQYVDRETLKLVNSLILATFITITLFPNFETTIAGYNYEGYISLVYPSLRKEMEIRLLKMIEHSDSLLLKDSSLLVSRFCELYSLIGHPSDFNPKIYIKLETDLPIVMEETLSKQLISVLSPFFNFSFLSPLDTQKNKNLDLIIASTKVQLDNQNIAIVYINPSLSPKDIQHVSEIMNTINDTKVAHE